MHAPVKSPRPRDPHAQSEKGRFSELFKPKLVTVLEEGYQLSHFRADAVAGLTVAIVALPLSMAIAIASGATPAQGLITAIVGGFLVSLLGGSRHQIGGPAGAFIVLVAATIQAHGMGGLILATFLSGLMLAAIGFLRLGTYIKFIPYPVTVGFTAGIAVIIFASQLTPLFGLTLGSPEPGPLIEKLPVIFAALPTVSPVTAALALAAIGIVVAVRKLKPHWPGLLIAVVLTTLVAALAGLPVATIGTAFGGIPSGLPAPSLPAFDLDLVIAVLPSAIAFTLLGAIESLLSAVVADGMTGRRHRSNCELVAQGVANIGSSLFGGFCVTGTIARTATNVRAGAVGPVSGMLHAIFLLGFMMLAAPLASYIPLASLAGVLAVVAWSMVEKHAFATLLRASWGDAAVLLVTFLLTIFRDLTEAIVVGFALGALIFIHRMSTATFAEPLVAEDEPDGSAGPDEDRLTQQGDVIVYRVSGALFFGAAASIGSLLDRVATSAPVLVLDLSAVPMIDSTAGEMIASIARSKKRRGGRVVITGTTGPLRRELFAHGVAPPVVRFDRTVDSALRRLRSADPTDDGASAAQ
jgi:sulfate permease, SulP family